jgi:nucleoside-diphosphate-sugar epimerase
VLLEAVSRFPVERLVYASSSSVYGDRVSIPMREDAVLALTNSDRTTLDESAMGTYLETERVRLANGP